MLNNRFFSVKEMVIFLSTYRLQHGYNLPFSYYNDMAWGGLTHIRMEDGSFIINPLFVQAVPNANDRTRIINRVASETINEIQGSVTPTGEPCED